MKCSNCGHENTSDANICVNCNHSLATPAQSTAPAPTNITAPGYSSAAGPAQASIPSYKSAPSPATSASSAYSPSPAYSSPTAYGSAPSPARPVAYTYPQPYYYPPSPAKPKQPFTITDAYIIIGFVLSIIGVFTYAFILLPAGIGFSIIGFVKRTNSRTLGLSVAGIVIGVVACFVRVGMLLNELGIIPDWLSSGIF